MNWFRLDPWFSFRMIFHGWHPNSPLSHPTLVRNVFFSKQLPGSYVETFMQRINPYESFLWSLGMGSRFVNPQTVLQQISHWGGAGQRVMVLAGGEDKIMTAPQMQRLAGFYRTAFASLVGQKKLDAEVSEPKSIPGEGDENTAGHGVRYCVVPGAGHHLQNDVMWEVGAQKLLEFYKQL